MGQCTELMKEAYQSNTRFRLYVDRYREHHNDDLTAITADEALQHACVKEVYLYYQEENKDEMGMTYGAVATAISTYKKKVGGGKA